MNKSSKTSLVIGFVVVVLFLFFGGGAMTGSMLGGGMMGQGGGRRIQDGTRMDKRRVQLDVDSYCTYPRYQPPAWLDDLREEVTELKDESRSRSGFDLDYEEHLPSGSQRFAHRQEAAAHSKVNRIRIDIS